MLDAKGLIGLRRVSAVAASPCGTWLAVAAQRLDKDGGKYVSDLWRVPVDGGTAVQLTFGEHDDRAPCFRADGALGFLSGRPTPNDSEADARRSQVHVFPPGGGEPVAITDEPLGVSAFRFAADGDRLVVLASVLPGVEEQRKTADDRRKHGPSARRYTRMPARFWDHWLPEAAPHFVAYASDGTQRRDLTPDADYDYRETTWNLSPDGERLLATRDVGLGADRVHDHALELIACDGSKNVTIRHDPCTWLERPIWSPDGRALAVLRSVRSAERHGARELWVLDPETGEGRRLLAHWDRWPFPQHWGASGLIATADDEACIPVFRIDPDADTVVRLSARDAGGSHAEVRTLADGRLFGIRSRTTHPPEAFVMDAVPDATLLLPAPVSGFEAVAGLRITTFDTEVDGAACPIQSTVVEPDDDEIRPGLLWIHGGPVHAFSDGWHWRWNALVAASWGFRVLLPNPTGSTGFGQAHVEGIWGNTWGGQCYRDLMAVTDVFQARGDIGPVCAMGGSFGGYMSNWIGANTDRFEALVTHASIFDLSAFHGVTDFPGWWILEMGGVDPYTDRAGFDRYSPREYVAGWTTPTLVIHGDRDYRCPVGESLALFEALQSHGVQAELLVFPDENHWILKPRNVVAWYEAVREFLGRFVTLPE